MLALYGFLCIVLGIFMFYAVLAHDGIEAPMPAWWSAPVGYLGIAIALAGVFMVAYNIYTVMRGL